MRVRAAGRRTTCAIPLETDARARHRGDPGTAHSPTRCVEEAPGPSPAAWPSPTPRATSPRSAVIERHHATGRDRARDSSRGFGAAGRAPSPPPWPTTRTTSSSSAARMTPRCAHSGRPPDRTSAAGSSVARRRSRCAATSHSRVAGLLSDRPGRRRRRTALEALHRSCSRAHGVAHDAPFMALALPRPVRDPRAQDHGPWARGRRAVRARAAGRLRQNTCALSQSAAKNATKNGAIAHMSGCTPRALPVATMTST